MCARRELLAVLLLAPWLTGCGTMHAPRGTVPAAHAAGSDAWGGWIRVVSVDGRRDQGELIAVSADSLWLLVGAVPLAIAAERVRSAEVTGWDSRPGDVVGLAALGTLSTISNGAFLLLTAPAWIVTGAVASSAQAAQSRISAGGADLQRLAVYARFPAGLPPGLDLRTLRPRPGAS
jgi:hypothetical protein